MRKKLLEKLKSKRAHRVDRIVFTVTFFIFLIYSLSLVYPFIWCFFSSLKEVSEYFETPFGLPKEWLFSNYAEALSSLSVNDVSFISMTINSLWWAFGGTFISIFVLSLFSYTVAKYEFKGKNFIQSLNMALMLLPIMGSMPAAFRLYNQYGIIDTPLMLLTATGAFGSGFLILQSFFKNLSWSYAEAAYIDGAGDLQIWFQIMLPMSLPPIFAMALTTFIGRWNDYLTPIIYLEHFPTLSSGLYTYRLIAVERFGTYPVYFAGVLVAMLPIFMLYTAFHKTIMENMLGGGLKE